jgi:hypothetical protein
VHPTHVTKQEGLDNDIFKYPTQASTIRPFNIIFIPDPLLQSNKERALVNLAFVQTTISVNEWKAMEHLKGSYSSHAKSKNGQELQTARTQSLYAGVGKFTYSHTIISYSL